MVDLSKKNETSNCHFSIFHQILILLFSNFYRISSARVAVTPWLLILYILSTIYDELLA